MSKHFALRQGVLLMQPTRQMLNSGKGLWDVNKLLLDDVSSEAFHKKSHELVYQPARQGDKPIIQYRTFTKPISRLFGVFPCQLRFKQSKCLWCPFIIDTGAPASFLHEKTLEMLVGGTVKEDVVDGLVAGTVVNMKVNQAVGRQKLAYLNLLGIDFLQEAIDSLPNAMVTLIHEKSVASAVKPIVWVKLLAHGEDPVNPSSSVAFTVLPATNNVDGLKKAVKALIPEKLVGVAVVDLKVYAYDARKGEWKLQNPDADVHSNDIDAVYHVQS
jgi:hypothetical protein